MTSSSWAFTGPLLAFGVYYFIRARRLGRHEAVAFLLLIPFAFFLEYLNIRLHRQYAYSSPPLMLGGSPFGVPLAVCVSWASMIFVAMRTSDAFGFRWTSRPWTDGLIAVSIDLIGDPVSSTHRIVDSFAAPCSVVTGAPPDGMGIWTWCLLAGEGNWIGVPFDNYFGWFVVVLLVSFAIRWSARTEGDLPAGKAATRLAGLLVLAFIGVFALIQAFLMGPFGHPVASGLITFGLLVPGLVIVARGWRRVPHSSWDWGLLSLPMLSIATGLGYFFTQGPGMSNPVQGTLYALAAVGSSLLLLLPYLRRSAATAE